MEAFGVRFAVRDLARFEMLACLLHEIKHDKESGIFRDPAAWLSLIPDDIRAAFDWSTDKECAVWNPIRNIAPVYVPEPSQQIGKRWCFDRVFESIEEGDYDLLGCVMVSDGLAELQIDPRGYPYGGVGPLIALVEAFGFVVLGVNECGQFESRDELLSHL